MALFSDEWIACILGLVVGCGLPWGEDTTKQTIVNRNCYDILGGGTNWGSRGFSGTLQCLVTGGGKFTLIQIHDMNDAVAGWNPAPVEVGSLSHYLQGFIHPSWCRISAINTPSTVWILWWGRIPTVSVGKSCPNGLKFWIFYWKQGVDITFTPILQRHFSVEYTLEN